MNADFEQVIGEIDSVCPKLRDPEARIVLKSWAIRLRAALSSAAEAKGVEYDRELIAEMLNDYRCIDEGDTPNFSERAICDQIRLLRAAYEADAAGVGTGVIKRIREIDAQGCSDAAFRLRVRRALASAPSPETVGKA